LPASARVANGSSEIEIGAARVRLFRPDDTKN